MNDKTRNAMKLIVEWRNMKQLCEERTSCKDCPYYINKGCDLISTNAMIETVANVFQEELLEE